MAASKERTSAAANATQRELVLTRVFDAPRELVFKAWTDPKRLAQWWGPKGFTNPVCEWDVRPGGAIRVDMKGPDGTVYPMGGVYHEIVEPERIVFTATCEPGVETRNTVTFEELDGMTKLTLHAVVVKAPPEAAGSLAGMEEGWKQSMERLEDLAAASSADREIVSTRVFDAPRELVFQMWTDPEHVAKWWGPKGFTNTIYEMDVRPGGVWRFVMHGPDGVDYQNKIVYIEVVKPERLVYSHVSGPQFRATVTFTDQGDKTGIRVRMLFPSATERDDTVKKFGAVEGLNQTLERLAQHLAHLAS
jgi:uncharacterized protein YndB with AHSA1/START domain